MRAVYSNDVRRSAKAGVVLERLALIEDRMTFARAHYCGSRLPLPIHLHPPREIAQARVMIFVELRVANFLSHDKKIFPEFWRRWIFRVAYGELLQLSANE